MHDDLIRADESAKIDDDLIRLIVDKYKAVSRVLRRPPTTMIVGPRQYHDLARLFDGLPDPFAPYVHELPYPGTPLSLLVAYGFNGVLIC